jgi:hypothetical protein
MSKFNKKQIAATLIGAVLIVGAVVAFSLPRGLTPVEHRLLGRWTYRTTDQTHQLRVLDLREDRIAILAAPEHVPAMTDFFDWRVDGDMLVLTHYVDRQPGESGLRKVHRAAMSARERLRGGRAEQEPVETLRIVQLGSDKLELQLQPLDAEPSPGSVIKLVRATNAPVEPQGGGIR